MCVLVMYEYVFYLNGFSGRHGQACLSSYVGWMPPTKKIILCIMGNVRSASLIGICVQYLPKKYFDIAKIVFFKQDRP